MQLIIKQMVETVFAIIRDEFKSSALNYFSQM